MDPKEIKTRCPSIQHAWRFNQWKQLKTAPLWTFMSASLVYARAAFLRNSCPHIPLQWSTGCYRWSLDSAHMVPRWSQQSLGGHTWVNLSKVKGSLNMANMRVTFSMLCMWLSELISVFLLLHLYFCLLSWVDRCSYQQNIMNPKFVNGFNITSTPLPPWCIIPNTFKLDTSCSTKCFSSKSGSRKQHNLEDKCHNLFFFP